MTEMTRSGVCEGNKMGRIGYRPYWVLNFSILVRAVHQIGAAVVLAAFLLDDIGRPPSLYLAIACLSGGLLFFTEWMRHRQIYRELTGMTTLIKLLLLGGVYHSLLPGAPTVLLAFILASIGAHAPKLIRHRLLY
ncbi:MAG: hypothetical protein ACN4GW_19490 [Desulforhopalus sp.]